MAGSPGRADVQLVSTEPTVVRVTLAGEFDLSDRAWQIAQSDAAEHRPALVEVDASAVGFGDSSFLRGLLLLRACLAERGGRLVVVDASSAVRQLLAVTGLADHLMSPALTASG